MDPGDRANELYWGSDESVNRIADELDLSKGALYEMIRPLAAGLGCPLCSAEVVHPNRTAKERGKVDCTACGWHGTEDETVGIGLTDSADDAGQSAGDGGGASGRELEPADDIYSVDRLDAPSPTPVTRVAGDLGSGRLIAGGALLGAAVGLALVIWARRR